MYTVYVLKWPRSPLIYVGRTISPEDRLKAHRQYWKPLGLGSPYMEILETNLSAEASALAEQKWILFLGSTIDKNGLNSTYGAGTGGLGVFGTEDLVDKDLAWLRKILKHNPRKDKKSKKKTKG